MGEKKVLINICKAPFGNIFYTEGLRAGVGASAGIDENIPTILFQSDGVFYCLKDVDRTDSLAYFQSYEEWERDFLPSRKIWTRETFLKMNLRRTLRLSRGRRHLSYFRKTILIWIFRR